MPIVDHESAAEIPWRPGYRRFTLAGKSQGVACSASLSILEPGAGAPTHFHNAVDEVIVVLDGTLDVWIEEEHQLVGPNHTIALPAGVPHGFRAVGSTPAKILAFLPQAGEAAATTYLDGAPPQSAARR